MSRLLSSPPGYLIKYTPPLCVCMHARLSVSAYTHVQTRRQPLVLLYRYCRLLFIFIYHYFLRLYLYFVWIFCVLPACLSVRALFLEARRGHQVSLGLSYRWLRVAIWVQVLLNLGPLEEQPVFLATESSSHHPESVFGGWRWDRRVVGSVGRCYFHPRCCWPPQLLETSLPLARCLEPRVLRLNLSLPEESLCS